MRPPFSHPPASRDAIDWVRCARRPGFQGGSISHPFWLRPDSAGHLQASPSLPSARGCRARPSTQMAAARQVFQNNAVSFTIGTAEDGEEGRRDGIGS